MASIDGYLRILRLFINEGMLINDAIQKIPSEFQELVLERWHEERVPIRRVSAISEKEVNKWFMGGNYDYREGHSWLQLRKFLIEERGRNESEIDSLDLASNEIISRLDDPRTYGASGSKVKGLVIGHVQSGKTANYTAVAAKAFDAGYRVVIVIAGIHNSLRRQTQLRLDVELGLQPNELDRPTARSSSPDPKGSIVSVTNSELDFYPAGYNVSVLDGARVIFVIKKNATVLRRLLSWLGDNDFLIPTLIIDDEADQASINTGGNGQVLSDTEPIDQRELLDLNADEESLNHDEDLDPSVMNGLVRSLLNKFANVAYVAYTATPYANVFIDHAANHQELGEDLYPTDFIVSLAKPNGYVGAEELFGESLTQEENQAGAPLNVVRIVKDSEARQLTPGNKNPVTSLPESLVNALKVYLLCASARHVREGGPIASTMLIHASHRQQHQAQIYELVRKELGIIRQRWLYMRESVFSEWEQLWTEVQGESFNDEDTLISFELVATQLTKLIESEHQLSLLLLNTSSDDELDYERNPTLNAIVIGGNKLSRGLTLEGLQVSYFVRNAGAVDTLTQMGRFFGHRASYVDLTRIYMTQRLKGLFKEVSEVELQLRRDIALYARLNKTPSDFAPRVKQMSSILPTAANRMGTARIETISYSGLLLQTTTFPKESHGYHPIKSNLESTQALFQSLGEPEAIPRAQLGWSNVPSSKVVDFLNRYVTSESATKFRSQTIADYIVRLNSEEELLSWTIAVQGRKQISETLGAFNLGIDADLVGNIERNLDEGNDLSIGTLINPATRNKNSGDELIGISEELIEAARKESELEENLSFPVALRSKRNRNQGLLTVYPISPYSEKSSTRSLGSQVFEKKEDACTIIGLSIVFPFTHNEVVSPFYVGKLGSVNKNHG
jgi:hypothetical protein